jgi:hypothetical protein
MHDPLRRNEVTGLLDLARWYRDWAQLTHSQQAKERRRELADHLEAKARKLLEQGKL